MRKKLKIGIIGPGNHFKKNIFPVLKNSKYFKIEGIMRHKNKKFESFNLLKEKEFFKKNFDIIYISTPNNSHDKYILKILKYKFHVMCEKPFIIKKNKLNEIINLSKKNNNLIFETFMYIYHPLFKKIENMIKSKIFGKLRYIVGNWKHPSLKRKNNQYNKKKGNGFWFDSASYPLSFDNYFFKGRKKIEKREIKKGISLRGSIYCNSKQTSRYYFWGEGQSYRNDLELFFDKATIYAQQFFAKRLTDKIKIRVYKNFSTHEISVKNENQFHLMFKNIYFNLNNKKYQDYHRDSIIYQCNYLLK